MSLQDWANDGWMRPHQSSRQEIAALLAIVDRDITDAADNTSFLLPVQIFQICP
ncbi:MAG: hypothetical protein ABSE73_19155 [Planctomycetota bacterium]